MHILFEEKPEYRYEALALAVLGGRYKYDEPFGIAATDFYDSHIADASLIAKRALSIILTKMIFDNNKSDKVNDILKLNDQLWANLTSSNVHEFVDNAIKLAQSLGY